MTKGNVEEAIRAIVSLQAKKTLQKVEEQSELLLPGIPDDLTVNHITSKLPWRDVHGLPSLNHSWRRAVQTRQIFEGRVSSHSTETLLVVSHQAGPMKYIALYSSRDNCCYFLPSIPQIAEGIPSSSQCISLDGKIYILGGRDAQRSYCYSSSDVYVLDLVGQRRWKHCASMQKPRRDFGCAVISGKICVFGGISSDNGSVRESEQYDPKVDAWSLIMPTKHSRWCLEVAAVGDELCVYGGFCDSDDFDYAQDQQIKWDRAHPALFLEAYHRINDNWRLVESFMERPLFLEGPLFVAKGKFYSMTKWNIHVYDMDSRLWRHLHSFLLRKPLPIGASVIRTDALAVNDEVLAVVDWAIESLDVRKSCLLRSRGFGTEKKWISWEMVHASPSFKFLPVKYPVQL